MHTEIAIMIFLLIIILIFIFMAYTIYRVTIKAIGKEIRNNTLSKSKDIKSHCIDCTKYEESQKDSK